MPPRRRRFQPRIAGTTRMQRPSGLLPEVEEGLQRIARAEGRSISWVVAEIVCAFFGLDSATGKVLSSAERELRVHGPKVRPERMRRRDGEASEARAH